MAIIRFLLISLLTFVINSAGAQVLEAAHCEWDDQLDEWKIPVNVDEYVEVFRQFGGNPYRRWNFNFETLAGDRYSGYMQLKRAGDLSYWDFFFHNENLSITTVYMNDVFTWKITHYDQSMTITSSNRFGSEWTDRNEKNIDWHMYQVEEGDIRDWYIDEKSHEDEITFPMRLAAIMIVIEMNTFGN